MRHAVALLCAALLAGCAVRRGGDLPERSADALVKRGETLGYDLRARSYGIESPGAVSYYRSRAEPLLARAFAKTRPGPGDDAPYLSLAFETTGDRDANELADFLSIATFTLLPTWQTHDYSLAVTAELPGEPERTFQYRTSVTTVFWLPLMFVAIVRAPEEVEDAAVDQLILNLLADLERPDG
jgi:hypothetical protein